MSDDRDFRSWLITPEQADKIKQGEKTEAAVFYLQHKERFYQMAYAYARSHNIGRKSFIYDPEEMTAQVLLDLPYLNWKNSLTLTMSLKHISFAWSSYGGYAQHCAMGLIHSRNPWDYYPESLSLDSPMFDEDENGDCILDRMYFVPYSETPEGILIAKEEGERVSSANIVHRLQKILSPKEAEFLELYLDGLTFVQISEEMGVDDCSCIQAQTISKLIRRYNDVIDLLYTTKKLPSYLIGLVPDRFEELTCKYNERMSRKRKGDKTKRTFANEAEKLEAARESKRRWYEKNKELQNERRRARRAAELEARKARASI